MNKSVKNNIQRLEKLISQEIQDKYFVKYCRQSRFLGNGVYGIPGTNLYSTDTRELFLLFCAAQEEIEV